MRFLISLVFASCLSAQPVLALDRRAWRMAGHLRRGWPLRPTSLRHSAGRCREQVQTGAFGILEGLIGSC